jgi:hypothetical protein
LLLIPIPFFVLAFKWSFDYAFLAGLIYYMAVSVGVPVYLSSRNQAVYSKASLIAWLKLAGKGNFTPKEQEIIDKALGKAITNPVKVMRNIFARKWKAIFLVSIAALSLVFVFIPLPMQTTQKQEKQEEYVNIEILEHYLSLPLNSTPQVLTLVMNVNTSRNIYISTCKVIKENITIGVSRISQEYYSNSDYFSIVVFLDEKIEEDDVITVLIITYPEKYTVNKVYSFKELVP